MRNKTRKRREGEIWEQLPKTRQVVFSLAIVVARSIAITISTNNYNSFAWQQYFQKLQKHFWFMKFFRPPLHANKHTHKHTSRNYIQYSIAYILFTCVATTFPNFSWKNVVITGKIRQLRV